MRVMKLLRTIRLDPSDTFVFERAAEPGEWAVSGAFMFAERRSVERSQARRARRFAAGFLGVASFGWSTLGADRRGQRRTTASPRSTRSRSNSSRISARPPSRTAVAAAEEEVAFAASLCNHPLDTLIAVRRSHDGGEIREAFRTLRPRGRAEADARVLVPRRRGRRRAGRGGRPRAAMAKRRSKSDASRIF